MTSEEIPLLLKPAVKEFINDNLNEDIPQLILKSKDPDIPVKAAAEQILCINKARKKLPSLLQYDLLYEKTALEQASGEAAARFKASLLNGDKFIDLTGGLGIDTYFISKEFEESIYSEQNELLAELFKTNSAKLAVKNITIKNRNGLEVLSQYPGKYFDWIYLDPSRRSKGKRFIILQNYEPDVIANLPLLLSKGKNILIKISPVFEIEELKKIFHKNIREVFVVSVDGECKEILMILNEKDSSETSGVVIKAVVIDSKNTNAFILERSTTAIKKIITGKPAFFYEPDPAIIKAKLTDELAAQFNLFYFNPASDYQCSNKSITNFPGRVFCIKTILSYGAFKEYLKDTAIKKANVARRNFPDDTEKIKAKFKISDGGADYFFFTKDVHNKLITIHCKK